MLLLTLGCHLATGTLARNHHLATGTLAQGHHLATGTLSQDRYLATRTLTWAVTWLLNTASALAVT